MPELPEVETVRRGLAPRVEGHRIDTVVVYDPRLVMRSPLPPAEVLPGDRLERLRRRGKWLLGELESGLTLVLHLRMSGRLLAGDVGRPPERPPRATITLDDATAVHFVDQRRFGELMTLDADGTAALEARIGPDADTIGTAALRTALQRRARTVKSALTDQALVGGIGNMYADEALWGARLSPFRPCSSLSDAELRSLARSVRKVMRRALAAGGTSTRDGMYVDADGNPGWFAVELAVYQREGLACPRCGTTIERVVRGATATRLCPSCQT
ncbi:MAG: bifunctional DNA-formamidopyrimidine glycosylase/DNA-(apurinic or apyrimidinic site) lyase [Acidimicrobiia bacterium]|nr:bifunctional DNA-formamidopyrimidine glycosylase/DNA-(apurinic or apyrimidinic site) lyase [Acidimicrobiia bacterium]